MKQPLILLVILLLLQSGTGVAQEALSLENAIALALENNFAIRIARTEVEIDRNNASLGNAGLLPTLTATAGESRSINDARQEFYNGSLIDRNGAKSDNRSVGVALNWTLFDGLAMFSNYAKLRTFREMGELETRIAVEDNLAQVIKAYHDLVQAQKNLKAIEEAVSISEKRMQIAQANYKMGSGSKLDLLDARVDLNEDRSAVMRAALAVANGRIALNRLMGRAADLDFATSDSIRLQGDLALAPLEQQMLSGNQALLLSRKNLRAAEQANKAASGPRLPKIGLNVGYNLARTESQAGFIKSSENQGLTYGLSASYTLFDGFNISRNKQNAEITVRANELRLREMEQAFQAQLRQSHAQYRANLEMISLESDNLTVSRENVQAALERYRLGSISALELREVQRKYLDAQVRLLTAQYEAAASEVELLRLSGGLIRSTEE